MTEKQQLESLMNEMLPGLQLLLEISTSRRKKRRVTESERSFVTPPLPMRRVALGAW